MGYERSYSPVPPPCPSPQFKPLPLPIPPVYPRRRSISSSTSSPRETYIHSPRRKSTKHLPEISTDSFVSSLQDAIVVGSPSTKRRLSEFNGSEASSSRDTLDRPLQLKAQMAQSCIDLPSPTFPSDSPRRRSECPPGYLPTSSGHPSYRNSLRSPVRRPHTAQDPPPVPPLPSVKPGHDATNFNSKKLAPIRIPELGLGIDEKLRSPISPTASRWKRRGRARESKEDSSFLDLSPKREQKCLLANVNGSLRSSSVHASPSLPDIKTLKRRSSSLADRLLKFGLPQAVH